MNKNFAILLTVFVVLLLSIAGCAKQQPQGQETQEQTDASTDAAQQTEADAVPQTQDVPVTESETSSEAARGVASTDIIYIKDMTFNPETITVPVGTTVTWVMKENEVKELEEKIDAVITEKETDKEIDEEELNKEDKEIKKEIDTVSIKHIVTSDDASFESQLLEKYDDKFTYTFTTKGTVNYYCKLHPAMTGTVIVE